MALILSKKCRTQIVLKFEELQGHLFFFVFFDIIVFLSIIIIHEKEQNQLGHGDLKGDLKGYFFLEYGLEIWFR